VGQGLSFDGNNDGITAPLVTTQTQNITLSAWVRSAAASQTGYIVYNGNGGSSGYGLLISDGACGLGNIIAVLLGGANCDAISSTYALPPGEWTLLTLTREGSLWKLYANAEFKNSGTANPNIPTDNTLIGDPGGVTAFNGKIDEVRIYNRALSADEVKRLYNLGR
jgi:arabinan endo-1,5-alpha-L-arabinosidase